MKFSSLAALDVVVLTTFSAANDENFVEMISFPFQCISYEICTQLVLYCTHCGRKELILPISFRVIQLTLGNHLNAHGQ